MEHREREMRKMAGEYMCVKQQQNEKGEKEK